MSDSIVTKMINKEINDLLQKEAVSLKQSGCLENNLDFLEEIKKIYQSLMNFESKFNAPTLQNERKLHQLLDKFFKKAGRFESRSKNQVILRKFKKLFRNTIKYYLFKSKLLKHGYLKPSGFPGDFRIIEAMYDNRPISFGIGRVLDKYFLSNNYVKAVRDRKDSMKLVLKEFIKDNSGKPIRILNLACGSCREIRELMQDKSFIGRDIAFTLVDKDHGCLKFSQKQLRYHSKIKFTFVQADVIDFLKRPDAFCSGGFKKQNLIYSIGLADYLPNSILVALLRNGSDWLAKEGRFIVAHKNTRRYTSIISDWGSDWKFIPRDQRELRRIIIQNINMNNHKLSFFFKKGKLVFYVNLKKKQ